MSAHYNDRVMKLPRPSYDTLQQLTNYMSCPGGCSCNLGQRSNYDQMQLAAFMQGHGGLASIPPQAPPPPRFVGSDSCKSQM